MQLSRDAGGTWVNVIANVAGMAANSPVSHIEPSRVAAGAAYVSFDRHMFDDLAPHVFKTDDFGESWTNISGDLPEHAYVWVLREDPRNPELLYAGTELGLYATRDGGSSWGRLHLKNFPTVAVNDLIIHARDNDLVVGTHGRGMWIFDDATPIIQQWSDEVAEKPSHLFPIRRAIRFSVKPTRYGIGDKKFLGPNPPYGALITYHLKEKLEEETTLTLEILDGSGEVLREVQKLSRDEGMHRVSWDLNLKPRTARKPDPPKTEPKKGEEEQAERGPSGPKVTPGTYRARLTVGADVHETDFEVVMNPAARVTDAELDAQFRVTKRLWEMQSRVNLWLRGLDSLKAQLEDRRAAANAQERELGEQLDAQLTEHSENIETLAGELAMPELKDHPAVGEATRLYEKLSDLFRSTNSVNAAPSPAQRVYFDELTEAFGRREGDVRTYLESVAALNDALAAEGLPELLVPRP